MAASSWFSLVLKGNIISPANEKYIFPPSYLLINMFVLRDFQKREYNRFQSD